MSEKNLSGIISQIEDTIGALYMLAELPISERVTDGARLATDELLLLLDTVVDELGSSS